MDELTPVGKTKDQGWEVGVRRTYPTEAGRAWECLLTQPGLGYWYGSDPELKLEKGAAFKTAEGAAGQVVSFQEGSLLRLRWQPPGRHEPTTLQIRVIPAGTKATISFHQERLAGPEERDLMQKHWSGVLDKLGQLLAQE